MFKAKVSIIKNVNGKQEKIEKEFNSPQEYEKFLRENSLSLPEPKLSLSEWGALGQFIDNIFEDKLSRFLLEEAPEEAEFEEIPVDMDKYEKEARKIEEEKERKEAKKSEIKRAIKKLEAFVKTFEKEGKKDLAKSAKEDIKKLKDELAKIK